MENGEKRAEGDRDKGRGEKDNGPIMVTAAKKKKIDDDGDR